MRYLRAFLDPESLRDADSKTVTFVASTSDVARDGMIIDAAGWKLDNFHKAGGPILFAHNYKSPPIGRGKARVDGDKLLVDVEFDEADEFAAGIARKVRDGFMRAVSVGWDTLRIEHASDPKEPPVIREQDLLEVSVVPVGADPGALKVGRGLGVLSVRGKVTSAEFPNGVRCGDCDIELGDDAEYLLRRLDQDVLEIICGPCGERAGAVLSTRNKERLQQAVTLIGDVLASSDKPASEEKSGPPEEIRDKPAEKRDESDEQSAETLELMAALTRSLDGFTTQEA